MIFLSKRMREIFDEDGRVIERNGFEKFLEEIQGKIFVNTSSQEVIAWNMIYENQMKMIRSLESKSDADSAIIFCS
jgi:dissimilatory sulfite reductase (desulfoviridin) alpha/beta subunit